MEKTRTGKTPTYDAESRLMTWRERERERQRECYDRHFLSTVSSNDLLPCCHLLHCAVRGRSHITGRTQCDCTTAVWSLPRDKNLTCSPSEATLRISAKYHCLSPGHLALHLVPTLGRHCARAVPQGVAGITPARSMEDTSAVGSGIDRYNDMHDGNVEGRNEGYAELVNTYYNLATDFYEYGWGQVDWLCPAPRSTPTQTRTH